MERLDALHFRSCKYFVAQIREKRRANRGQHCIYGRKKPSSFVSRAREPASQGISFIVEFLYGNSRKRKGLNVSDQTHTRPEIRKRGSRRGQPVKVKNV
jgi:hypothetical protein